MNPYTHLSYARAIAVAAAGILPAGAPLQHDQIALANESQFNEAFFNQPLTAYAVGWRDPRDLEAELNFIAPPVPTTRRFNYAEATNAEEFLSDSQADLKRAIGGDFKRVKDYTEKKTNAETDNKGLTIRIDLDRVAEKQGWQERATSKLIRRVLRSELLEAVTLLSAAAVNSNKTWDTTAGKDPDHDVDTELNTAETASGIRPTRVFYGETAWSKRRLSHRAQDNAGGYASASMNEQAVGGYLGADVRVSRARYQSTASAKSEFVGAKVLMFSAMDDMDEEDPSNIKRFVSMVEGGGRLRVYSQQVSAKLFDITVEIYSVIKITSTLGIRQFTVS